MTAFIQKQIIEFIVLFYGGILIAMLREVTEAYLVISRPSAVISILEDILFWILAALITSAFLYYAAYGALSVHCAVGFLLGAGLWSFAFGGKMTQFIWWFYGIINKTQAVKTKI